MRRTDVAANGKLIALGAEQWDGGTQTIGKIAVVSIEGVDQGPVPPVDCFVPASGVAKDPSVSQDARQIAFNDAQGLKVVGAPTGPADPCALTSPPVVISPTGEHASIGGANVASFLPPTPPPPAPPTPPTPGPGGTTGPGGTLAAPTATIPASVTRKALGSGLSRGKPVTIGSGSATAKSAGTVTVKLKLNAAARKRLKKLKGAKVTLRLLQDGRATTRIIRLR